MNKKWVLITGGTRGIGRGLVEEFARQGVEVVFTYQNSHEAAMQLTEELKNEGACVAGFYCDGTNSNSVANFSREMLTSRGAPNTIVNNVGITKDVTMMRMSEADWGGVINTNLNSAFLMIRNFVQPMVEHGGGSILQMSSVSGLKGNSGQTNYSATKAALIGMTRSLAHELGRFNVRVNAIAPGFIATEMLGNIPEAKQKEIRRNIPLRRFGQVKEVAALTAFLASDLGSYITGQTFVIDGGMTA